VAGQLEERAQRVPVGAVIVGDEDFCH
jgi:hypothetical protein